MTQGGWHPDPTNHHELRWWDGTTWTEHVSDHGVTGIDPMPPAAPVAPHQLPPPAPTQQLPAQQLPTQLAYQPTPTEAPPGSPPPASRGRIYAIAGAVVGLAVAAVGLIVFTGGDDDGSDATERTEETDEADDTEPDDTSAPTDTVVTTTTPETTTTGESTTTVESTTTAAPTTTVAVATVDDLVVALPADTELPAGFLTDGGTVTTTFSPSSGFGAGFCGGGNADQRALTANAVASAYSTGYLTPLAGWYDTSIYAFPTDEDAASFMAATAEQVVSCTAGVTYQLPEGDQPGEYDGFADDVDALWDFVETTSYVPVTVPGADEAFQVFNVSQFSTVFEGTNFSGAESDAVQVERFGSIVVVYDLFGTCCLVGFSGVDPATMYQPTVAEVGAIADVVRPPVVARLGERGLI